MDLYTLSVLIPTIYLGIIILVQLILAIRVWWVFSHADEHNHHYNRNPRVSIIVPAYNEEVTIVDSIESMLSQNYINMDIIVINDGSTDKTLDVLKANYSLKKSKEHSDKLKERMATYNLHFSKFNEVYYDEAKDIIVIDKVNGGKSTALNAGIVLTDSEYVLGVDADTILRKDAITNTLRKKDKDVDGVSCMIGIANGNPFDTDNIQPLFPKKWLLRRQWLEYLTSFVLWRSGNNAFKKVTVIPGAYSFIRRSAILEVGGYKRNYLAEDGELTLNLIKNGYKIQFISEFMAWTECPESIKGLGKQRLRWYRGTLQNMIEYRSLLFNPKQHWFISFFSIPFAWFADIIGGWVEVFTWCLMAFYLITGVAIDWVYFVSLWAFVIFMYSITMTLLLSFTHKKLYPKDHSSKIYRLIPIVMVETFSYHFLNLYWIIKAHINEYMKKEHVWNKLKRKGLKRKK